MWRRHWGMGSLTFGRSWMLYGTLNSRACLGGHQDGIDSFKGSSFLEVNSVMKLKCWLYMDGRSMSNSEDAHSAGNGPRGLVEERDRKQGPSAAPWLCSLLWTRSDCNCQPLSQRVTVKLARVCPGGSVQGRQCAGAVTAGVAPWLFTGKCTDQWALGRAPWRCLAASESGPAAARQPMRFKVSFQSLAVQLKPKTH